MVGQCCWPNTGGLAAMPFLWLLICARLQVVLCQEWEVGINFIGNGFATSRPSPSTHHSSSEGLIVNLLNDQWLLHAAAQHSGPQHLSSFFFLVFSIAVFCMEPTLKSPWHTACGRLHQRACCNPEWGYPAGCLTRLKKEIKNKIPNLSQSNASFSPRPFAISSKS